MVQTYTSPTSLFLRHKKGTSLRIKDLVGLKAILWLLPVLLCVKEVQPQSYSADVRKLSVEDGLSNRFATSICKDSRGFIWIGTRHGLNRYDGYTFKLYTKENSALKSNDIERIHEDAHQNLWVIHQTVAKRAIDILNPQTGRIQNFDSIFKPLAPFKAEFVHDVYFDAEKTPWFITKAGKLYRYKNKRFGHIFTIPKLGHQYIFYAGKDFLWLFQGTSLTGIDLKTNVEKTFDVPLESLLLIGVDDNYTLWLFHTGEKKFFKVHWEKQLLEPVTMLPPELPEFASSVTFVRKHNLNPPEDFIWWLSNPKDFHSGFPIAWHLREKAGYDFKEKMTPLLTYGSMPLVSHAYPDTENRLWLATQDGIFILSLKKNKFTTLTSDKGENYSARGIAEDNSGILYIGTYGGTLRLHPEKGILKNNSWKGGLAITKDRWGKIWSITAGLTIEKYDPVSGKSRYYSYKVSPGQLLPRKWTLMSDTKGHIRIGSGRGLYILEPETGRFRKFMQYNAFTELKESSIYHLQETGEGIWMATSSGLYLLEPGKGITTRYSGEQAPPWSIPFDHILHFHRDSEGIFWLATKGGGLIRFNPEDGSSRQFTTEDGLSSNIIYAVYEDDYGKLWLPSNYGLMQFDKNNYRGTTYLKGDGIAHNEFNTNSHYRAADGRLYFGGLAGLTIFHPKNFISEDPVPAPLRIARCRVLDGKTGVLRDKTAAAIRGTLELFPSDKSLLLEFALLNFKNTQGNSYTYTIEGLDTDWTPIRTNSLRLNALPYGKYILRIKGQGIGGEQSANALSIDLLAHKPFYLKNGFILSCVVTLILLVYGIFRWRLQNLKRAKLRLQETVKQRTQEIQQQKDKIEQDKDTIAQQAEKLKELNITQSRWFNNIAHELRTPLTLIHGPIQQFLKKQSPAFGEDTRDIQLAGKNTKSLLRLVNEMLDISRLDSNRLKLHQAPAGLSRLIRESTAHFESFARQKGVTLSSHIHDDLELNIDKDRIRNILVNLISNALKFTHAGGNVSISVHSNAKNGIAIVVKDTGDGIPEKDLPHVFERYFQVSDPDRINQGGIGIGLSLSLELARLHGGDLSVESRLGEGSSFTLTLPQSLVLGLVKPITMPVAVSLPETPASDSNPSSENIQNKSLILLVEDHPDMRQYIRSFMEEHYHIAEAADGLEALDYLKKNTPDLIISDIMMPRMDGITLAKTLKTGENLKNLPFITLTARTGEADKIAALRIGIDDYLTKPFNPEELEARVKNLIRNYRVRSAVSHTDPGAITTPGYRDTMLTALKEVVLSHLEDYTFTAEDLATSQNMSSSSLRRFLKKAAGLSPGQFIREIRLQRARRLLEAKQYSSVAEVMYAVGFEKASYFTKVFTERFGKNPSEYL